MLIPPRFISATWLPAALVISTVFAPTIAQARPTYGPATGGSIPDATTNLTTFVTTPGIISSNITVSDNYTIASINSVTVTGLTHTFAGDLIMQFQHVTTGTAVDLVYRLGQTNGGDEFDTGDDSNYSGNYTFALTGASLLTAAQQGNSGYNIPAGTYAASSSLDSAYVNTNTLSSFIGQNIGGTWRLTVTDANPGDTGSFTSWQFNATAATVTVPEAGSFALCLPVLCGGAFTVVRRLRRNRTDLS